MPNFTNFTLAPDGNHVGEALGAGRFTVLAPTVGVSGNSYRNIRRVPLIEVECLEAIGIYPVNKKQRETSIPQTDVEDCGVISLQRLASQGSQDVLEGVKNGDRSEVLTKPIKEWYGWENWLQTQQIDYLNSAEELAHKAGENLGLDEERVERILKSVDADECQPALLYEGTEEDCWQSRSQNMPIPQRRKKCSVLVSNLQTFASFLY